MSTFPEGFLIASEMYRSRFSRSSPTGGFQISHRAKHTEGNPTMTTQSTSTQAQNTQSNSDEAAKLRRVLSVAEPKKAQDKAAPATTKR